MTGPLDPLRRSRLRLHLALLVLVPLALLATVSLLVTVQLQKTSLESEAESRARDMTVGLAQNVGAGIRGAVDESGYRRAFRQLTDVRTFRNEVVYLRVEARDPRLAYRWENADLSHLLGGDNVDHSKRLVFDEETGTYKKGRDGKPAREDVVEYRRILPVRAVLRGPDHSDIGVLEFGLSRLPLESALAALVQKQVAITVAFLLVAGWVSVRFSRRLGLPLEQLESAVATITLGRTPEPMPEEVGSREVRRLTAAFNRMSRELDEKKRMALELKAARELQERLFPRHRIERPGCRALLESRPANEVGGDFFTAIRWPSESDPWLEVALGDVSGKGIGAALLAATTHGLLCSHRTDSAGVPEVLQHTRETSQVLYEQAGHEDGGRSRVRRRDFVALLIVALDVRSGRGFYVNAGQVPPLLWSRRGLRVAAGGAIEGDPPLGILRRVDYRVCDFQMEPGDRLVLLSDGIVEAMNQDREILGFDRLLAAPGAEGDLESRHAALFRLMETHAGDTPQHDDATVVVIERTDFRVRGSL